MEVFKPFLHLARLVIYIDFQQIQGSLILQDHLGLACCGCLGPKRLLDGVLQRSGSRLGQGTEGKAQERRGKPLSWVCD